VAKESFELKGEKMDTKMIVREIRDLGIVINHATKVIREQQEIRKDAKNRFKELLLYYPHVRGIYYNE
jgi:hypothetical protein